MSNTISSPVTEKLQAEGIVYQQIEIPLTEDKKPVRNLEELLKNQGHDPNSVVRSLLFKTGSDRYVLLAVAGGGRADWGTLRKHLGEKKLRMAEFDEVPEATGYVVGAVPPIALPDDIVVLLDDSIDQFDNVVIGSGVLGYALGLKAADLKQIMGEAARGQFVKT
ncbi:MAG: Cys-tRNA(Pro) deacylase [Methylophaga sp.]